MMWRGHFDQRHSACLEFSITRNRDGAVATFRGIIDTGFSGFVQIPMNAAAALELTHPPFRMGRTMLANGSHQPILLKRTPVTINGETQDGLCQAPLSGACPVLVGMGLLRRFERVLLVSSKHGIFLPHEQDVTLGTD